MPTVAVFPGTFDPITFGHENVIEKALSIFPEMVIAIGENPSKKPMFDLETRTRLISETVKAYPCQVVSYSGLLARFCSELKVERRQDVVVVRGIRTCTDMERELALAQTVKDIGRIPVVWIPTDLGKAHISSSLFRELALCTTSYQDLRTYVPTNVIDALRDLRAVESKSGFPGMGLEAAGS